MTNEYYTASGTPVTGSPGLSTNMRSEFALIVAGFNLLPPLSGRANKAVVVNSGGTGLTVTTGTLALAGNFATTGAFNTTLVQGATVSLTLPLVNGTLATLAGAESLTNKVLVATGSLTASGDVVISGQLGAQNTSVANLAVGGTLIGGAIYGSAFYVIPDQVVGARNTGWTAMTGSTNKATAYATSTVTLAQLAGRVMAIQAALTTHGLLGT